MKFNKKNLAHYLIFILYIFSLLIASVLYFISPKKINSIVFTGHKLIGNLESLINSKEIKYKKYYLTFSFKDSIYLKKKKYNILYALNPFHLKIFLKSKLVVSSHGLVLHKFLKNFFKIKTISTGHAIKSNNNSEILKELHNFDEVWLFSNFEKKIYIDECNYSLNNLVVTGFPRIDDLQKLYSKKKEIKKSYNLSDNKKIVLYAPTDDRKNQEYLGSDFSLQNINLYKYFNEISDKLNLIFILKYHINTKLDIEIKNFIQLSKSLKMHDDFYGYADISSLAISDLLITDWSSIFVDFLSISKPIIFLDTPRAYIESGVSNVFNNDFIERNKNFEELTQKLTNLFSNEKNFDHNLKHLRNLFFEETYDSNNISRCVARIENIF